LSAALKSLENVAATPVLSKLCPGHSTSSRVQRRSGFSGDVSNSPGSISTHGHVLVVQPMQAVSIVRWIVGLPGNLASSLTAFSLGRGTRAISMAFQPVSTNDKWFQLPFRSICPISSSFSRASTATIVKAGVFFRLSLALVQVKGSIDKFQRLPPFSSSASSKDHGRICRSRTGLVELFYVGKTGRVSRLSVGTGLHGMGDKVAEFLSKTVASISSSFAVLQWQCRRIITTKNKCRPLTSVDADRKFVLHAYFFCEPQYFKLRSNFLLGLEFRKRLRLRIGEWVLHS
jgi:hypothetical protein